MTDHDRTGFAQVMFGLGEVFDTAMTEMRVEIYFRALSDLSLEQIRQAAASHAQTSRFFPKPVELRDALAGTVEDRAEVAWTEVLAAVRRVGYYGTPTWSDPAIKRAVNEAFGTWHRLCETLPIEGPGLYGMAKQFKAVYGAYARQDARQPALPERAEAKALLGNLKRELDARSLPAHGLE